MRPVTALLAALALYSAEFPAARTFAEGDGSAHRACAQPVIHRGGVNGWPCCCDGASKPRLTVWTSPTCAPCRQFWREFREDAAFRQAILSRFCLRWMDFDRQHAAAAATGIVSVPTFEVGGRRITGYEGKAWLWRQLTTAASAPTPASPMSPDSPESQWDRDNSRRPPPPLPPLSRPRNAPPSERGESVGSLTHATPDAAKTAPPQAPSQTDHPVRRGDRPSSLWRRLGSWVHRSVPFVLTGLELAGILGGTAATGGLGTIAIAALWRVWKRRRRTRSETAESGINRVPLGKEADHQAAQAPFPRRLDEARQLLALRQSEGRVATLDALRGMFLDDELTKLTTSGTETEAALARKLQTAIDARVDEVAPLSTTID